MVRPLYPHLSFIDAQVGKVLNELEKLGLKDETLIVLRGDYGWHLKEHKLWSKVTNFKESSRVPLVIFAPGQPGGVTTESLTELVDLYPTICDLLKEERAARSRMGGRPPRRRLRVKNTDKPDKYSLRSRILLAKYRKVLPMNSKEIVSRAIHYEGPERLPVLMGSLGVSDVDGIAVQPAPEWEPVEEGADEWNCIWSRTEQHNIGQVTGHPLEDLDDLDNFEPPSFHHDARYEGCGEKLDQIEEQGKYARCGIFMVMFERMHALHGFENTLMDLYSDSERLEEMADMIADTQISLVQEVSRRFPGRIDGWNMSDDWGTQQSSFISYEKWMEFFYPRYRRIFDAMHEAGCDVWVHSCGKINDIIEGYIKAGVDVVNLQQPRALGIQEIAERYRGNIAFESLSDIQSTLPTGDPEKIEADAEALMTHWAGPDGGFLFSDYGDDEAIGINDAKVKPTMYETFSRYSEQVYGKPLPPIT